jgi:hypothetical protein
LCLKGFGPFFDTTDAEALKAARQFVDGCDVEVWYLDRKIGRIAGEKRS